MSGHTYQVVTHGERTIRMCVRCGMSWLLHMPDHAGDTLGWTSIEEKRSRRGIRLDNFCEKLNETRKEDE